MPKACTAATAVAVEGATGKRSLQLDDLVLAVDRPTEQSLYAIQDLVAMSYNATVVPVSAMGGLTQDSHYKEGDSRKSATGTSIRHINTITKESHAARVASLFQIEIDQLRKADADFLGTPEQLSSLREALSLSWDWNA